MPFPSLKKMTRPEKKKKSFILLMTSLLHSSVLPIITSHFVQNLRVPVDLLKGTLFLSQSYYIDQIFLTQQEAYSSFPTKAILRSYCATMSFLEDFCCTIVQLLLYNNLLWLHLIVSQSVIARFSLDLLRRLTTPFIKVKV